MTTASYDAPRRQGLIVVVALALSLALAGCGESQPGAAPHSRHPHAVRRHDGSPTTSPRTPAASPTPHPTHSVAPAPTVRAMLAELGRLVVRPRPQGTRGYVRDAFGSDWIDTDHNGCNQRDDVLLRDAVPGSAKVEQQGACDHDVLAGTWHDPYTGRTLTFTDLKDLQQAEAIQIDHVVPLAEAWVSGAVGWTTDRRELFANDLRELLAVDGPTNMSKGDGDPAAWRPRQGYQCTYARRWVAVKTRWHLAVDASEAAALRDMLGLCS
jgi:hypothetical protein